MEKEKIELLESYFKTENDHWNEFTFKIACKTVLNDLFQDPETPLRIFSGAIDTLTEQVETPLQAFFHFKVELDSEKLKPEQEIFICGVLLDYLNKTTYEDFDLSPIIKLLEIQYKRITIDNRPETPKIKNIRETLKDLIQTELTTLPENLKSLELKDRLNILCKLVPYILPKIDSIHAEQGERD
jgi:hypothetical protein